MTNETKCATCDGTKAVARDSGFDACPTCHGGPDHLIEWARYALEHADCGAECKYTPPTRSENQALARDVVALADRVAARDKQIGELFALLERFAERLGFPCYLPSYENRTGWLARISDLLAKYGRQS